MLKNIEDKALSLYVSLRSKLNDLKSDERGQTSAEYIAVTAVAVLIAITVLYLAFNASLSSAITTIGSELEDWVEGVFPGGAGT